MSNFKKAAVELAAALALSVVTYASDASLDYRILATSKTSTMEKELNDAAAAGYRFGKAMGGKSANGGQEVVVAMVKDLANSGERGRKYLLLAATRTSTMQKEMQRAADQGYEYADQTVFQTAFGGREVVVIMELDPARTGPPSSYRLLATTKTSSMQKELQEAGSQGYLLVGLTVGKTEIGGDEIVTILRKN
ncbi:MAG TPA: hypothetical protein VLN48_10665 [Bryobacteraceae bacterium]|nr:hypothetical protein [Bryobacteraceae bacterium]